MTMTVEIQDELQSLVAAAVARGRFADEQELVADILRFAVPVLDDYQSLRDDVADSVVRRPASERTIVPADSEPADLNPRRANGFQVRSLGESARVHGALKWLPMAP